MVCLVETRANKERCFKFCRRLTKDWDWAAVPALGLSGKILTLWRKDVGVVTPLVMSRNVLHLVISSKYLKGMIFSVVYNP